MMIKTTTLSLAGLGFVALLAMPAQAAPTVGAKGPADVSTSVEKAASYGRRCWRRHGKLYCRRYVGRGYPYAHHNGWGPGWGYGPGLNLYFGGGGNRGWHGGGRHHGHHGGRHR